MNPIKNLRFFTSPSLKLIKNSKLRAIARRRYLRSLIVNPSYASDSLTLRPFKLSDARDFLKCVGDDQVTKFLLYETLTTEDEALGFIADDLMTDPWCMSICMNDCSVGYVTIYMHKEHKAEIEYALARKYWGQGIGAQAIKMAVKIVLKEFPEIVRLGAFVDVENIGSQRVLEKAGFKKEGLLRNYMCLRGSFKDSFIYGLLSHDVAKPKVVHN